MKIIELNIGLSTPQGEQLNFVSVLNALTGRGFTLIAYRVVSSVCKDGEEKCLAVKCEAPDDWQTQLATLSDKLGQDCIAIVGFIGHAPYDAFAPSLWVEPTPEPTKVFPDGEGDEILCDSPIVDGWTLAGFKAYLENQIIPDSIESGYEAYAEDLQTALDFICQLENCKAKETKPKHEGAHIRISTLCDVFERFYRAAPTIAERDLIDRLALDCGIPANY